MIQPIECVVAGHICLDITPQIPDGSAAVAEIFRPGKLVNVGPATVSTGGTVSNTGLPLRRLGVNVALMGKCGDDMLGKAVIEALKREAPGAEAGMQIVAGETSSYSVVLAPPGIDRMFLHCPGANDTFGARDIDLRLVRQARLLHFGYPPLMARTYANGGAELAEIFELVKGAGATSSLDLAYPDPASPAGKVDWKAILAATLPHVDIFTPSVEELTFMLRRSRFEELMAQAGNGNLLDHIDGRLLEELAEQCIDMGAAVVLVKCGVQGLYLRTAGHGRLEKLGRGKPADAANWAKRQLFEPSYRVAKVVSATGSGDCAIAGFLASLLHGCSIEDSLRHACAVGAQNVQVADAISGIKSWSETVAQVKARPAKNPVSLHLERWRCDNDQDHLVGPLDAR